MHAAAGLNAQMRPVSGKSCNPGDLTFWEETGRLLQFTVEVEEAVGMDGGVQQLTWGQGGKDGGKRLVVVMQPFTGRSQVSSPLLFRLMFPQKPPNQAAAVSRGFPYKKLEVGTSQVCNWIL